MEKKKVGIVGSIIKGTFADLISVGNSYIEILEKIDSVPIILPVTKDIKVVESLINGIDCLILQDGQSISPFLYNENPEIKNQEYNLDRDFSEIAYVEMAIKKGKKIIGVGRGMHLINVFLGGNISQSIDDNGFNRVYHKGDNQGSFHYINIERNNLLYDVFSSEKSIVFSNHREGINDLGKGLKIVAKSDDGLIEGFSGENILGVQFNIFDSNKKHCKNLIQKFIEEGNLVNE